MKEDVSMRIGKRLTAALAAITLSTGCAYAGSAPNLSRGELKKIIRSAHTGDDYASLAIYFKWRQGELAQKASAQLEEWYRRSRLVSGFAARYPRPMDSSRNRYESFTRQAWRMGQKAAYYENLAETSSR